MAYRTLRPSQIYFLQNSISYRFNDGRYLLETFRELLDGRLTTDRILKMSVFYWEKRKQWFVFKGHRRLYLYKKLEELGIVECIDVWELYTVDASTIQREYTSENNGISVDVLGDGPGFEEAMSQIIHDWEEEKRVDEMQYTMEEAGSSINDSTDDVCTTVSVTDNEFPSQATVTCTIESEDFDNQSLSEKEENNKFQSQEKDEDVKNRGCCSRDGLQCTIV
ncbi:uncharacterized protein LOC144356061 [Saccoglossus kowalevskii]